MTIIAKRLNMTAAAQTPIRFGEAFVVAADKRGRVPRRFQLHTAGVADSAILRRIAALLQRHHAALTAMIKTMTENTRRHLRFFQLAGAMRPFFMASVTGYLALKMRRVIKVDEFVVLPLLQVAMAGLARTHSYGRGADRDLQPLGRRERP